MASTSPIARKVFLSIIRHPAGMSVDKTCAMIAEAAGLDALMIRLGMVRTPPQVLGLVSPESARLAMAKIAEAGGDAFAVGMRELEALGATIKLKGLAFAGGAIHAEPWRSEPVSIRADSIRVIVRGMLDEPGSPDDRNNLPIGGGTPTKRIARSPGDPPGIVLEALSQRLRHVMDLHTTDGRVYQVDAGKFNFDSLGDARGPSDVYNIQVLEQRLATMAPDAVVDTYYSLWSPPAQHGRLRLPGKLINNEDPAFAFYSRWVAKMYEHIMGRGPASG